MRTLTVAIAITLVLTPVANVAFADDGKGLGGFFNAFEPNKDPQPPDKSGQENKQPDENTGSSEPAKPRPLTLDEKIELLNKRVASAERQKSPKPLKNGRVSRRLADEYGKYVEEFRKESPFETNRLKQRFRELSKAMESAMKQLEKHEAEFGKGNIEPGSIEERASVRLLSDRLFQVNLAGNRMKLEQLRWEREANLPDLRIEVVNSTVSIDLDYEERAPGQPEKKPSRGGGLIGGINRVTDEMDRVNQEGKMLKASFHVEFEVVLDHDGRNIHLEVKGRSQPSVDDDIDVGNKQKLRANAESFAVNLATFNQNLTIDHYEQLREKGHLEIDASGDIFGSLGIWKVNGKPDLTIRLKAR